MDHDSVARAIPQNIAIVSAVVALALHPGIESKMNLCPFPLPPPPSLARVQMYLEKKIETEITNAKKHAAKNKTGKSFDSDANGNNAACSETLLHHAAADTSLPPPARTPSRWIHHLTAAMACLKRKKVYEGQVESITQQRMNLEQQMMALEAHIINQEAFKAVQVGKNAMQNIHRQMNVESVDETMDQMAEEMDKAKEISDALGQAVGPIVDEDDLDEELRMLQMEDSAEAGAQGAVPVQSTGNAELDALIGVSLADAGSVPQQAPGGASAAPVSEEDAEFNKLMAEMQAS